MQDPSAWVYKDDEYDVVKHEQERVKQGFSEYDWWNFNDYLSWVIVGGLKMFKDGAGHPVDDDIKTMDDWRAVLDKMIAGFEAKYRLMNDWDRETLEADRALADEGMALFVKYYGTLWD